MNCKLLTFQDLKDLILSFNPVEQAKLICKYIGYNIIVHANGSIYELKENTIYESLKGNIDEDLLVKVSQYLTNSYNGLSKDDRRLLSYLNTTVEELEEYSKDEKEALRKKNNLKISSIFLNSSIKRYIPQLKTNLRKDNIEFDKYKQKLHYKNGYKCLKTLEFKPRINGSDFITKFINRDYKQSTEKQRNEIMSHLKKIYVDDSDRNTVLNILGRCIAGLSAESAKNTFLLGIGSSGKSTCMNFCSLAFDCYYKELKEDTFSKNNPKRDKIFNTYLDEKQILITCINEMLDENIDSTSFKKFIEGKLDTTILFKDGNTNVFHQSGVIFTSNNMPKFDMGDDGNTRRMEVYFHRSNFIIDKNKEHFINENKNIFKGNKNLKSEIVEKCLLDAWADIIYERSHLLINDKIVVEYSENFVNDKKLVEETDNPFKDFILQELVTDESVVNNLISKEDMLYAYKEFINKPNSNLLNKTLIDKVRSVAKELQIALIYDACGRRCKSKLTDVESSKGCWVNCRFKTASEKLTQKQNEKNNEPEISTQEHNMNEISELNTQIEELKKLLAKKDKEINELKKHQEEKVIIEDFDNIDIDEEIIEDDEEEILFENIYEDKEVNEDVKNLMLDLLYTTELNVEHTDYIWTNDETDINENIKDILKGVEDVSTKYLKLPKDMVRDYDKDDLIMNLISNY